MERVLVFANPIAGHGQGKVLARSMELALKQAGYEPTVFLDRPADVPGGRLRAEHASAAVVIGGDGTLRGVTQHMIETLGVECPPVLIVPMGTANLMAQHLGLRWRQTAAAADEVVDVIRQRRIVELDVARTNQGLLHLVAGVGLDGAIIHEMDRGRRGPIDKLRYFGPTVRAIFGYEYAPMTVEVDGQVVLDNQPAMAFIGNVPEYGTGFPLLPHAQPGDGMLDVCIIPCGGLLMAGMAFAMAAAGHHLSLRNVIYRKAKHIRVTSPQRIPTQIDGEATGFTPLEVELLPVRVPFIVSR